MAFSDKPQSFLLYGYDAGVLGGVQETKPFLHAMGVSKSSIERNERYFSNHHRLRTLPEPMLSR